MAQLRGDGQLDLFGSVNSHAQPIEEAQPVITTFAPTIPAPVIEKTVAASANRVAIEDAGAELVYNRRNRVKSAKKWGDISKLNDSLKVREAVKGNFWPKPDYAQLIKDGMQPMVAHIVKQVYDSVAVKPNILAGYADESIKEYISALNRVEAGLMVWSSDKAALRHWASANARNAGAMLGRVVSLTSLAEKQVALVDFIYPNGWKEFRGEVIAAGGNKLLGALQPGYDEIRRAMKALEKGWPEKREAWEVQGFRIVENASVFVEQTASGNGSYYVGIDDVFIGTFPSLSEAEGAKAEIKPFVLFNKRRLVNSFDTRDQAVEVAQALSRKSKGEAVKEIGVKVTEVEREGVARRMEGEDISSERLMTEFGLKGVNFGNWMKSPSARAEAQLHLNHAFDSFHDLADILGLPPKAMSLNGMLGLAIGAQGSGNNAAHFVPGVNEINLTRTSGPGSLGHEWAHAVDHYFAVQAGLSTASEPFLTEHVRLPAVKNVREMVDGKMVTLAVPRFTGIRPEMVAVFKQIVESMNIRPQLEVEAQAALDESLGKSFKNVNSWLKSFRRDFFGSDDSGASDWAAKAEARATFDRIADGILLGDAGSGHVAVSRSVYISPAVAQLRELYKSLHGRLYSLDQVKGLQANIDSLKFKMDKKAASFEHVPQMVATDYAKSASALDELKGGKPYFSTTLEKFARAFDAFVSDELEARAEKNGYLSHTGLGGPTVPAGEEREKINAGFKALVAEVKSIETEKGVALCSLDSSSSKGEFSIAAINEHVKNQSDEWHSMPMVTVVNTTSDLPYYLSKQVLSHADGVYCDGQVYIIAENIHDFKQLQKVIAHECVLHHSLEEMLGNYGFSKLHHGIQDLKKKGDPTVTALAENILSRYGVLDEFSETREIVARAGELCLDDSGNIGVGFGFMKSVFAGVASWLRDIGFKVPFSNIELQGIMHDAGKWIHRDRNVGVEGKRPALRADGLDGAVLNSLCDAVVVRAPQDGVVTSGVYSGIIADVKDGFVVQKVNREGDTVCHVAHNLSAEVRRGDLVDVVYQGGKGRVDLRVSGLER